MVNVEAVKIIHSVESIVATKNIYMPIVYYGSVTIASTRRRVVHWLNFCPLLSIEVKLEEIVSPIGSIVAPKNVEIIF